jgi:hypothetical protein
MLTMCLRRHGEGRNDVAIHEAVWMTTSLRSSP